MNQSFYCIGLCGQKQVGKDTLARMLIPRLNKELDKNFNSVAFADAVKNVLCLFQYKTSSGEYKKITREFIEEKKEDNSFIPPTWNMNIREAMCNIGDRFREIQPEIWMNIALLNNHNDKIITDIRYPNEAFKIKSMPKGMVIKMFRKKEQKKEGHRSEISMLELDRKISSEFEGELTDPRIPYDFVIRNDGTESELSEKINYQLIPFILNKFKYLV